MENQNTDRDQTSPSHSEPATDTETDAPPKRGSPDMPNSPSAPEHEVPQERKARRSAAVRDRQADRPGVDPAIFDNDTTGKQLTTPNRGAQQAPNQQTGPVGKRSSRTEGKEPLRLRLDVNLDLDIELRARIHGDVTLALL
jgi:hypothetical protein